MKRVKSKDLEEFKKRIRSSLQSNIYIYGNLMKYGLENDNVLFYSDSGFEFILMKYFHDYVFSAEKEIKKSTLKQIADMVNNSSDCAISGVESSINQLLPFLKPTKIKKTQLMKFDASALANKSQSEGGLHIASRDNIPELVRYFLGVSELSFKYTESNVNQRLERAINDDILAFAREGESICYAVIATAISDISCMLTDISVEKSQRNKGFAKRYTTQFCEYLINHKVENIFLYVESPIALEVYKKIGFKYIGDYWVVRFAQ